MNDDLDQEPSRRALLPRTLEVFATALRLGLTSFGGPISHLGYFHNEYVVKKRWLDERGYADLVALCQFLPGPASSQFGIAVGTIRAGLLGGVAGWLGFTTPSAVLMVLFALLLRGFDLGRAGWLHGLKIVAVAIVAQAVLSMWRKLIVDRTCAAVAIASMVILLGWRTAFSQVAVIAAAGLIGLLTSRSSVEVETAQIRVPVGRKTATGLLAAFFALLVLLPVLRQTTGNHWVAVADGFYRSGALVFGGGHVVLPLLEKEVVPAGWVSKEDFVAGYGAAQAVPGPLFTFSAYLGAMSDGLPGAALALCCIFLPGFLLILGALPFWSVLRGNVKVQGVLVGINAAVVGILLAALYSPLWVSAILAPLDLALAVVLFAMLVIWSLPPWVVVIAGAAGGMLLGLTG